MSKEIPPTDEDILAAYRLDLIEGYKAATAEMEYLRDILRGKRPLDDVFEVSPLDKHLGTRPPVLEVRERRYFGLRADDDDETAETEGETTSDEDEASPDSGASLAARDECVKRKISVLGRRFIAEIEDDGYMQVVPAEDRLGEPLLSGRYRAGESRLVVTHCALQASEATTLIAAVEKVFAETLATRRWKQLPSAGGVATRSARRKSSTTT